MRRMRNPNELFVGDLSYFCRETHLVELFSAHGAVVDARIKRSESKNKTLMYGFVRMESFKEALTAAKELNGKVFMGRAMKVELSLTNGNNHNHYHSHSTHSDGVGGHCQLHVGFFSCFPNEAIVEPDEGKLREVFEPFGEILDIVVKDYIVHKKEQKQEGYGFITFAHEESAMNAVRLCQQVQIAGIVVQCAISHRGRDHNSSDDSVRSPTGNANYDPPPGFFPHPNHSPQPLDPAMMAWPVPSFPAHNPMPPAPYSMPLPSQHTHNLPHPHLSVMPLPLPLPLPLAVYSPYSPHAHSSLPSSSRSFSSAASSSLGMHTFRSASSSQSNADHGHHHSHHHHNSNNNSNSNNSNSHSPSHAASATHTRSQPHPHSGMMMSVPFSPHSLPPPAMSNNSMMVVPPYPHNTHTHANTFSPPMGAYPNPNVTPAAAFPHPSLPQGQAHAQPHIQPHLQSQAQTYPAQTFPPPGHGQGQSASETLSYPPVRYWR